ncbi:hypothetical protein Pmani_023505 [Petrolisthes manimaculis]|uniref:Uncharacterized protein n=1 Tax=Petrolisthes manimaculis TaxID=1843537 RepID=A0AAE1PC97_9EUCA|nr:hypothetical protein Pmani_023505 [Petrolisthes manimaculis]
MRQERERGRSLLAGVPERAVVEERWLRRDGLGLSGKQVKARMRETEEGKFWCLDYYTVKNKDYIMVYIFLFACHNILGD